MKFTKVLLYILEVLLRLLEVIFGVLVILAVKEFFEDLFLPIHYYAKRRRGAIRRFGVVFSIYKDEDSRITLLLSKNVYFWGDILWYWDLGNPLLVNMWPIFRHTNCTPLTCCNSGLFICTLFCGRHGIAGGIMFMCFPVGTIFNPSLFWSPIFSQWQDPTVWWCCRPPFLG